MDIKAELLAHKYAQAFLHVWPKAVEQMYQQLHAAYLFLKKDRSFSFISKLPVSFEALKKERLKKIAAPFNFPEEFDRLIDLIIQQQRLLLLPQILYSLKKQYQQKNNIMPFTIYSSHAINNHAITVVANFLANKTKENIILEPAVKKMLIAGLRLQSDTLLWEYSIARQLHTIERLFDHEHKKF